MHVVAVLAIASGGPGLTALSDVRTTNRLRDFGRVFSDTTASGARSILERRFPDAPEGQPIARSRTRRFGHRGASR